MKKDLKYIFTVILTVLAFIGTEASANLYTWEGLSITGNPVRVEAELTINGDKLTIVLTNTSASLETPSYSGTPDDVLGSFYFDISKEVSEGVFVRPVLDDFTAMGDWYLGNSPKGSGSMTIDDGLYNYQVPPKHEDGWQYLPMDETASPYLGFGIGTVGNNDLTPNNFNGNEVDGIDYSIYAGPIPAGSNLLDNILVLETATFTFSGLTDFTNEDIGKVGFGFGTAPDSIHIVPLPAAAILGMLGLSVAGIKLRKYM